MGGGLFYLKEKNTQKHANNIRQGNKLHGCHKKYLSILTLQTLQNRLQITPFYIYRTMLNFLL